VIHVQDASVADTAMVSSVRFPNIAHLAISSSLGFIAHIESPIRWHNTWVCHNALVEGCKQVSEQQMIDEEDENSIRTPKLRTPHEEDKREVYTEDNT
jgi:hypothetical protein